MQKVNKKKKLRPSTTQSRQQGLEYKMKPLPEFDHTQYSEGRRLKGKVALISEDSSNTTGQVLHPNEGEIVNG